MVHTRLKHLPSAPWLLLLPLALLCLWLALRLAATLLDAGVRDGPAAGSAAPVPELRSLSRGSLAGWHLFGSVLTPVDHRRPVADLPDSSLDLTVAGILAGDGDQAGFAMIADASGQQQAYRVGDTLPGGARIMQIHADRVVVRHEGQDANLRLPWEDTAAVLAPSARPGAGTPALEPAPGSTAGRPATASAPVAVAGLETVDWGALQSQLNIDPEQLARQVRVQPVQEGGRVVGVRLSGSWAGLLAGAGLRPDDIITAVNGVAVTDSARARQVIGAVGSSGRAQVTVRRDGREETINVSLK